jgi:hypothetical protein
MELPIIIRKVPTYLNFRCNLNMRNIRRSTSRRRKPLASALEIVLNILMNLKLGTSMSTIDMQGKC